MTPHERTIVAAIAKRQQIQSVDCGHWYDIAPDTALSDIADGHANRLRVTPVPATPDETLRRLCKEYSNGTAAKDWKAWAAEWMALVAKSGVIEV